MPIPNGEAEALHKHILWEHRGRTEALKTDMRSRSNSEPELELRTAKI